MHIALVSRRYPPLIGGAEKVLSYLADALAAEGAKVTVLTSRVDPTLPDRETPRENLTVLRLPTSPLRFVGTWLYMRHLRNWFAANRVDVAYVSMLKHDAYVVVEAGRKRGFPVVLRPEGAGATGDVAWQSWGRFGRQIADRCKRANALVAISASVRAELIEAGYEASKIIDLPNGVPVPFDPWQPSHTPRHTAVFVGRLAPEKSLITAIDAWPEVISTLPDARLVLVGDGPERAALEARAREVGVDWAVQFVGSSSTPETYLREADVFVLPSSEEGMSIALLEAMALGLPVVASDIPGNRKLVTQGEHGRLVPQGNASELANALIETWASPEASRQLGQRARQRVEADYSIGAVARSHLKLFEQLSS